MADPADHQSQLPTARWAVPTRGASDPSSQGQGTTLGSFALAPAIGGATSFSSPDTPGMPAASTKTAWDFNPAPRAAGQAVTQLENARLGNITPEMRRVAELRSKRAVDIARVSSFNAPIDPDCALSSDLDVWSGSQGAPCGISVPKKSACLWHDLRATQ